MLIDKFTPKQAFVAGAVLTLLSLGTLGFLWTLLGSIDLGTSTADVARAAPGADPISADPPPTADRGVRPVDEQDHIRGDTEAPITVIEYSDFECPFCGEFHPTMKRLLAESDDIRWVYRHFPLSSLHPDARRAAEASECAAEQGEFWEMADEMFRNQSRGLSGPLLSTYAENVGLDLSRFEACLEAGTYASEVEADAADAAAAGASGTPFSVVVAYGRQASISGAVSLAEIRATIESLR